MTRILPYEDHDKWDEIDDKEYEDGVLPARQLLVSNQEGQTDTYNKINNTYTSPKTRYIINIDHLKQDI